MGLKYPKRTVKPRRKRHPKSLFTQETGTCYLCVRMHGDYRYHTDLEEHHIFFGPNRKLSEEYGLKVKLCPDHHQYGDEAVHRNAGVARYLQREGQQAFEENCPGEDFLKVFGKNYL